MFAHATGTFPSSLPLGTAVSSLDESLADAGASKMFTVKFQFDAEEMDRTSGGNRHQLADRQGLRNRACAVQLRQRPSTEVRAGPAGLRELRRINFTATVFFTITKRHG